MPTSILQNSSWVQLKSESAAGYTAKRQFPCSLSVLDVSSTIHAALGYSVFLGLRSQKHQWCSLVDVVILLLSVFAPFSH